MYGRLSWAMVVVGLLYIVAAALLPPRDSALP